MSYRKLFIESMAATRNTQALNDSPNIYKHPAFISEKFQSAGFRTREMVNSKKNIEIPKTAQKKQNILLI